MRSPSTHLHAGVLTPPPLSPLLPGPVPRGPRPPLPSPSSPGRGGGGSGGGGGLRSNDEFWSMGGNRGGWRGGGNKPEPRREPAAADLIRMLAATSSMGSSQQQQAQRTAQARADAAEALRARDQNNAYVRHMPRRWAAGEVYSPHDLSPEEVGRYFKRELKPRFDVFDVLGFNPLDNYAIPQTQQSMTVHTSQAKGYQLRMALYVCKYLQRL
ncbi:hypothetical protein GGTG_02706 [Gaeumannomyces tritici R3-111a-1]|uniref:Uncharacterized protein n=1 Tax=Gaeumannomyces tritici (strain R3-111a-1) TaxID=644352 RepID=J3NN48_GAET3|nr:hypothetical protein GGTG_02706 [Gaeumannomyces tritici R3-111a-1]EJT77600.1 hypothetical protein GGTG_02706 [Gaeumannomyces tritici R3-111a-1]